MTATLLPLYPYQQDALDAVTGRQRELISLPTGTGKTVIFGHAAARHVERHPDERVLILVDRDELASQAYARLLQVAPHLNVGVVKAARNEVTASVIVGSVQTLQNPARRAPIESVGLVIVDECDLSIAPMYQGILEHFGAAQKLGVTATPFRADGKSLYPTWQKVVYGRDISWAIRHKHLIPLRGKVVSVPDLDLRAVKTAGRDFRDGDLGEAMATSLAPELVVKAWLEHAAPRKTLAFFPTVAACYVFAEAFRGQGVDCRVVHGGLPDRERAALFAGHAAGDFPVLANCQIASVGYDDPTIECILMGRPTKSKRLHMQIVGRGPRVDRTRPYGEQDCLLLYVTGGAPIPGLQGMADLSDRKITDEAAASGKTLIELEDELDAGEGVQPDAPVFYQGPVVVTEFDPLGNTSAMAWVRTKGGNFFLRQGEEHYVFLMRYPAPLWSVVMVHRTAGRPALTEHRGIPLEEAMLWGEDLAAGAEGLQTAKRGAAWRKKPASEKLMTFATNLGLTFPREDALARPRAGLVSDQINYVLGSRRIDPLVCAVTQRSAG